MGQPGTGNTVPLWTEYIGSEEQTQGTETSKYLVEEKTIVISPVAASEKETV